MTSRFGSKHGHKTYFWSIRIHSPVTTMTGFRDRHATKATPIKAYLGLAGGERHEASSPGEILDAWPAKSCFYHPATEALLRMVLCREEQPETKPEA